MHRVQVHINGKRYPFPYSGMQSDSDTESEHEYPRCRDGTIALLRSNSFTSNGVKPEKNTELGREDALSAVARIKGVDLFTIRDVRHHCSTKAVCIHCFVEY